MNKTYTRRRSLKDLEIRIFGEDRMEGKYPVPTLLYKAKIDSYTLGEVTGKVEATLVSPMENFKLKDEAVSRAFIFEAPTDPEEVSAMHTLATHHFSIDGDEAIDNTYGADFLRRYEFFNVKKAKCKDGQITFDYSYWINTIR